MANSPLFRDTDTSVRRQLRYRFLTGLGVSTQIAKLEGLGLPKFPSRAQFARMSCTVVRTDVLERTDVQQKYTRVPNGICLTKKDPHNVTTSAG